MSSNPRLWLIVMLIIISSGLCKEIAYSYGASGAYPLDSGNVTGYNGSDIVTSAIASAAADSRPIPTEAKTVEEIKKEINLKLNVGNPIVQDEGYRLIRNYGGDGTISQICSIYDYMVGNWSYARDLRGIEQFRYSNKSLELGKPEYSGQGDCDDFSILLASLIESIGGTSRIMLAYGPMGGHAYTEVYLGKAEGVDSDVDRMIKWLKARYNVPEIKTHTNMDTGEVWLNLDWWKDPNTGTELTKHPGGPFFEATSQIPILIREDVPRQPLKPLNDPPIAQFLVSPTGPNAEENVTFDASESRDVDTEIKAYHWDFGEGQSDQGRTVTHAFSKGGIYNVTLTVTDDDDVKKSNQSTQVIKVNYPPFATFTFSPADPSVGESVSFDGTDSRDVDGKIKTIEWNFDDENKQKGPQELIMQHEYSHPGVFNVTLRVMDEQGAEGIYFNRVSIEKGFELRSAVATEDFLWNDQNFSTFYYSLDDDIGRETLSTKITDAGKLSGDYPYGIRYETTTQKKNFKLKDWGSYGIIAFMGEIYFAGYDNETKFIDESSDGCSIANGYLHKILVDKAEEIIVDEGASISLMEGYEVFIRGISDDGLVYLDLIKEGKKVESQIKASSRINASLSDQTYIFKKDVEDQKSLATIGIHIKNVYKDKDQAAIVVDGIWQISERPIRIEKNTQYDKMTIIAVNSRGIIAFNKDNGINLSKKRKVRLMNNLGVKTANNNTLRYYLYENINEPGSYEIKGTTASGDYIWNPQSFCGFYYDIDDDTGGESIRTRISGDRTLSGNPPYGVTYETITQEKRFKFKNWGSYKSLGFFGKIYFAGYLPGETEASNFFYKKSTGNNSMLYNQIEKILIDENVSTILTSGTPLRLAEGYVLAIKSIDIDGNKIYLELSKDGQVVDSKVVIPPKERSENFLYSKNIGTNKDIELIKVHFKNAYRGSDVNLATMDGIWQVSEKDPDKVILNSSNESILSSGNPLKLAEGYVLAMESIDVDGNKIYLELSKDELVVDSKVVIPPNKGDETFLYTKNIGSNKNVNSIKVHFKNAYRGSDVNLATIDGIWQVSEKDPDKVILNSSNESILSSGNPLKLAEGYVLAMESVDVDGNKIYLELSKDEQVVDSKIVIPPIKGDETFLYAKNIGSNKNVNSIKVHFKNASRGVEGDLATIDGIWQVSEKDPSKVILNSSNESILSSSNPLKLAEGYVLAIKNIDVDGNKIYLELSKDEQVVDSKIVIPPNKGDETFLYTKNIGSNKNVNSIKVHFKNAFRGADVNLATIDGIWQVSEKDPSKVILNNSNESILSSGNPLKLAEGYVLAIKNIDVDGNKIYLEISKDEQVVDSRVVIPPNKGDETFPTYYYKKTLGDQKDLVIIAVDFKNAFRGAVSDIATIDGIWQISDYPVPIGTESEYGKMRIASIDQVIGKIVMDNKDNEIELRRGEDIYLSDNINIKVSNSKNLRYYIYKNLFIEISN